MKILMVDKFYFIKGGAERYLFELSEILKLHGHRVIPFSMKHASNYPTEYENFFVENIDFNSDSSFNLLNNIKIAGRVIYSFTARKRIETLINQEKPDLAHIHMIDHQLSPSILHSFRKYNIPVIQTVHQYKLVCPNYLLYNPYSKRICEKCLKGAYYHPIIEKCHKNSRLAGLLLATESYFHKLLQTYRKNVNIFHVPSKFMGLKLKEAGIDNNKIEHLFYTIKIGDYSPHYDSSDYFLYYGRLYKEKGILTLLAAMTKVVSSKLLIVGEGPQEKELKTFVLNNKLNNVEFIGLKRGGELKSLVSNAKFVVVPSEWYENSPLVIYESFALGKPVIGSNIGGIPELIDDNVNGLIFEPGNSDELADKINFLLDRPKLITDYGKRAREKAEKDFSPEPHYEKMLEKYQRLLDKVARI
ncbi:glycosyltransferase family 1 protein [candidate division KSB1 bacterium]|nr:MAG: glycosyltransferase family 1 protein [candidate division KSB1 bacterium]